MDKQQIKKTLDHLAAQGINQGQDLWPRIRAKAAPRRTGTAWWVRLSPAERLGWSLVLAAVVLSIGMTVYAASPVIGRLFLMDDQLKNQDYSKLGQHFELSQTKGDVTITVQWAYADTNRVLVGYSVKSADGRRFDTSSELTDASGVVYQSNGGYGITGQSDILKVSLPPGEGATLVSFSQCPEPGSASDAKNAFACYPISANIITPAAGKPGLALHFTVLASFYIYPTAAPTTQAASPDASGQPQNMTAQGQPVTLGETVGPFVFDFSVPVEPALK